ncbi:MAG: FMN-binding protein [Clostridiales bacterium]|nr:FMN-binding protein [Clostridiales bacterium]
MVEWRSMMKGKVFLKKALCFVVCLVFVFSMAGCSGGGSSTSADSSNAAAKNKFKAGSYTATAEGKNGPVTIKVTFSNTAITAVDIVKSDETAGLGDEALKSIAEEIKTKQTLAVDTVTGATYSSKAILTAVEDCVKQAGGDVEALKAAAPKTNSK